MQTKDASNDAVHANVCLGLEVSAATGEHAPVSGWWRPAGDPAPFRYIQEGSLLPALNGSPVVWSLVFQRFPARSVKQAALATPEEPPLFTAPVQQHIWNSHEKPNFDQD